MSEELKSCPFCGGESEVIKGHERATSREMRLFYRVFCRACQVRQLFHRSRKSAITAWNTRAGEENG